MTAPLTASEQREEIITDIIMAGLQAIERAGFLVPVCDHHGREYVHDSDTGEPFCNECAADGGHGELCDLGLDSVAIDMAEQIEAALSRLEPIMSDPVRDAPDDAALIPTYDTLLSFAQYDPATGMNWVALEDMDHQAVRAVVAHRDDSREEIAKLNHDLGIVGGLVGRTCNERDDACRDLNKAREEIAKLKAERDNYLHIIGAEAECLPGCDSMGHAEGCPYAEIVANFERIKGERDALVKERDEARAGAEHGCAVFENDESCENGKCWDVQAKLPVGLFVATVSADGHVMDASVSTGTTTKRGRPAKGAGDGGGG